MPAIRLLRSAWFVLALGLTMTAVIAFYVGSTLVESSRDRFGAAALILVAGTALSLLMFVWLRSALAASSRTNEIAAELTRELRQSEEKYRLIFEQSPLGLLSFDHQGAITACNGNFSRLLNVPREKLVGLDMLKLPDQELVAGVREALAGRPGYYEGDYRSVNSGKVTPVRVIFAPMSTGEGLPLGGVGIIEDITERQRSEQELRKSEAHNRALLSANPDLIFTNDPSGKFLSCHATDPTKLFVPPEAFLNQPIEAVLPEEVAQMFKKFFAATIATNEVQVADYTLATHGSEKHYEARIVPYLSDRVMTIIRDVTEQKKAAEEQRLLQAQLLQAQKMESLGSLAGGVAHDMNNVLGAILGLASAHVESEPEGSPAREAFDTIAKAAQRGGQMVQSLLSFARQSPAEQAPVDLNQVLREEVGLLERTTLSRVRLELDLDPALRPVLGDAGALSHAFMNLCVNAVDAMPDNGTLTLRTRLEGDRWAVVSVQDTGTGMPPEVLAKALDPFFTTKDQGHGTGLGLAMVYSTVKAHHGQLELTSQPGQGTCVTMRFPACEEASPLVEAADREPAATGEQHLRILAVDDDELVRGALLGLLSALGHEATPAWTGEEALTKLEAGLEIDLVILDMNMPGLGGKGTLPRLRALRPTVPVLLSTGRADQTALDLVAAHENVTLLPKPFSIKDLKRMLAGLGS